MTIRELNKILTKVLRSKDYIVDKDLITLVKFITSKPLVDQIINVDKELSVSEIETANNVIRALKRDKPIPYITGSTEFYGYEFQVSLNTLIPRPETELLVESASKVISGSKLISSVADICCGSGCIIISLVKSILQSCHHNFVFHAYDISPQAIKIARLNADNLLKPNPIKFIEKNILTENLSYKYNLIITNPPYLSHQDYLDAPQSLSYEPKIALSDDADGLSFYRKLAEIFTYDLIQGGYLICELHPPTAEIVTSIFKSTRHISDYQILQDLKGLERVGIFRKR